MLNPFRGFSGTSQSVPKESGDRHCTLTALKGQDSSGEERRCQGAVLELGGKGWNWGPCESYSTGSNG